MKKRFTLKELEGHSDMWVLLQLVYERQDKLQIYSPLRDRLNDLKNKILNQEELTNFMVKGSEYEKI